MGSVRDRRRRPLLVSLGGVFLFGLVFAGGTRPCEPSPDEENGGALRVRVVEEDHPDRGVPYARVRVWRATSVWPDGLQYRSYVTPARADTDADGRATIQRITRTPKGLYTRWTDDADLYVLVTASGFTISRRTILSAVWAETEVVVALARGTVVAGKVRRADGSAAKGVHVQGTQPEQADWVLYSHKALTDSHGAFRLSGMFPGLVSLYATLHDGDAAWVGASTVEAGTLDAELRLPVKPVRRRLRILVTGADGSPVATARWDAEGGVYLPYYRESSHGFMRDGEFVLPADPSVQWLTIVSPCDEDGQALPWTTAVVGPLGNRGGDLRVALPRGHTVSGTARDPHGNPLRNITVLAKPLFKEGDTERPVSSKGWQVSSADWEGRFRIEGVPAGRVEFEAFQDGWCGRPVRVSVPTGPVELTGSPLRRLRGRVRHPDGSPAPDAALYAHREGSEEGWRRISANEAGDFTVIYYPPCVVRTRAGLLPAGPEDMAASEVTTEAGEDPAPIVLTVPRGRSLLVRVPDWPASVAGAARLANGPYSRGFSRWILDGIARFEGIDPGRPLSLYCGPLPDGRIGFLRDVSAAKAEMTVPLVPSRSIRGRARGFPPDAEADRVWADDSAFEVAGHLGPDGRILIRGVPPGPCRVCVVFKRGEALWVGSVRDNGAGDPVEVEVGRIRQPRPEAWFLPRPTP